MPKFFEIRKQRQALIKLAEVLITVSATHPGLRTDEKKKEEIDQLKTFIDAPKKAELDSVQAACKSILKLLVTQKNEEIKHDPEILQKILIEAPEDILANPDSTVEIINQCRYCHTQDKFTVNNLS